MASYGYLSYFKSDSNGVKGKVGIINQSIPCDVEIRFYIPGGIVIGAYHRQFLFIITMIFMYAFRKTRLKILHVILR